MHRTLPLAMLIVAGASVGAASVAGAAVAGAVPAPAPSAAVGEAAFTTWRQGLWHFEGRITGMPADRTLLLALTPTATSTGTGTNLAGETLLLDRGRVIRDAAPVRGSLAGGQCHLRLSVLGSPVRIDGFCTPSLVAGRVTSPHGPQGLLARLLPPGTDARGDGGGLGLAGEAWLAPSTTWPAD